MVAVNSLTPRLWVMNADCEAELAVWPAPYRRIPTIARRNRRLAPELLWLTRPGDALEVELPWEPELVSRASERGVELVPCDARGDSPGRSLEPWGWTPSAATVGVMHGAVVDGPPFEVVRRVSSKLFSHALERELGVGVDGASVTDSMASLAGVLRTACPRKDDKWVVKSPFGFAARERVLGRGPAIDDRAGKWAARRFANGERLLVEPWHDVIREYGVPIVVHPDGEVEVVGFSDLQTNRAGAAEGYWLGRPVAPGVAHELARVATLVGQRLAAEGYAGPAGIDALEHTGGLRPLVEINARWTMGHVAVAVARTLPSGSFFKPGGELTGLQDLQD